jgi:EAL domain-containing protein (putative c-di-GMP-specific phosphodiesterase class I)
VSNCSNCRVEPDGPFDFTMAFQPIVKLGSNSVWGYEALVRGCNGEGAGTIVDRLTDGNRYWFDQSCRVKAIEMAARMFPPDCYLSINFVPNAVYEPRACIRKTLETTGQTGFDPRRLMFEFTEGERITDPGHVKGIITTYREMGFLTAIDDFGAGYAGLALLSQFQPDILKIDMELIRNIDRIAAKQTIVKGVIEIARGLDITLLAEGIETAEELEFLREAGIELFQGYYIARPELGSVPAVTMDI